MASKKELERRIARLEFQLNEKYKPGGIFFEGEPTINGKVQAIVDHLKLEFTFEPERKARIVVNPPKGKK